MTSWVMVDWGTSALRGARVDEEGRVGEERSVARGILTVAPGEFAGVFAEHFGDWMAVPGTRCLISGMAGSRQGWAEAPYAPCPAGLLEVAAGLVEIDPGRIAIVPGLSVEHEGVPDVMRGEETQIFGALRLLGITGGCFVLPGTHSKWADLADGRITGFATLMTGEFYALLRQQSILARTLPADDGAWHAHAFEAGLAQAQRGAGLLHTAFSVRTLSLFDRLPPAERLSYLSGLVIGEELRSRALQAGQEVVVVGNDALARRYVHALALRGVRTRVVGASAAWSGLWAIAQARAAARPVEVRPRTEAATTLGAPPHLKGSR